MENRGAMKEKRTIGVLMNQHELYIESKRVRGSCVIIRACQDERNVTGKRERTGLILSEHLTILAPQKRRNILKIMDPVKLRSFFE